MNLKEQIEVAESALVGMGCKVRVGEVIPIGHARARITHRRPSHWLKNPRTGLLEPDPRSYENVDEPEEVTNLLTNAGRIFMHQQAYGASGLGTNGLCYIALSIDPLTETATSTTLSSEIAANGLARALATVTLPTGSGNQTLLEKVFTCATAPQSAQKAAVFSGASGGVMNHVLAFISRPLQIGDVLDIPITLTLG